MGIRERFWRRKNPRVDERAFDSERKRMTTVHGKGTERVAYCKGAADELLDLCTGVLIRGKEMPFSTRARKEVREAIDQMAGDALRVLAVAMKRKGNLTEEKGMVFLGLTGMMDPPREEAKGAVESFQGAYVDTVMITGIMLILHLPLPGNLVLRRIKASV